MPEEIDYRARVARGIALMDEKWPHWATEIDLEKLDIESGDVCMTAQYSAVHGGSSNWRDGMHMLNLGLNSYTEHGFRADDGYQDDYATLNYLWRGEIERRRAQAKQAPAEPEASA